MNYGYLLSDRQTSRNKFRDIAISLLIVSALADNPQVFFYFNRRRK
jgi:hypothetical protein